MSRPQFKLFQSHLDLAHAYWKKLVSIGDTVVDATCGNGHDSLVLCELALNDESGTVYLFDTQPSAIEACKGKLKTHLNASALQRVHFVNRCHSEIAESLGENIEVKLIVYNLGYLPGGDKHITTQLKTTLTSVAQAHDVLAPGGVISITCYPGHPEGKVEQEALLSFAAELSPKKWNCCHHVWPNRKASPSLLLIQKSAERHS